MARSHYNGTAAKWILDLDSKYILESRFKLAGTLPLAKSTPGTRNFSALCTETLSFVTRQAGCRVVSGEDDGTWKCAKI